MDTVLVNIGNTHTQIVLPCCGLTPQTVMRFSTSRFPDDLPVGSSVVSVLRSGRVFAASVVPAAAARLVGFCGGPDRVRFLSASDVSGIDFSRVDVRTLGADRIANAAAAVTVTMPPVLVLDCGTALTLEAVDGDRRFRGGMIAPGRRLSRLVLHEHTAQLPWVEMSDSRPGALGVSTAAAIRAGVDLGVLAAVRGLVDEARSALGARSCPVLVTGGDASYFCAHLEEVTPAPPFFTLLGMSAIARALFPEISA